MFLYSFLFLLIYILCNTYDRKTAVKGWSVIVLCYFTKNKGI